MKKPIIIKIIKNTTPLDFNSLIAHIKNSGNSTNPSKDLLNLMNH